MLKKPAILIAFLLLTTVIFFSLSSSGIDPNTAYVDLSYTTGTPGFGVTHFNEIQLAIDTVPEGWMIKVNPGTYQETLTINKFIILDGQNKETTIINGNGADPIIQITSDEVILSEFTIQNGVRGIRSNASDLTIEENIITECEEQGIYLEDLSYTTITDTLFIQCSRGIRLENVQYTTISNNIFLDINDEAVFFSDSSRNTLTENKFVKPSIGLTVSNAPELKIGENEISLNSFVECGKFGITMGTDTVNNNIYQNAFILNLEENARDTSPFGNAWDDGTQGNYWDDYTGLDYDGDGIGDTPYDIPGEDNQDEYPLLSPPVEGLPLEISAPSTVLENEQFQVTVTVYDTPIEDVIVSISPSFYLDINPTNNLGITTLQAPLVSQDTQYTITATKSGYQETSAPLTVLDSSAQLPALVIHSPSSVIEEEQFTVTVTSYNVPVPNVKVTFNEDEYFTNQEGEITPTAPEVETNTDYMLTANLTGYQDDTAWVTILNQDPESEKGWIFGTVLTESLTPVNEVKITITSQYTSWTTFTDNEGRYVQFIPAGSYTLTASKAGYEPNTKTVTILQQQAIQNDITLELLGASQQTVSQNYIDYTIQQKGSQGVIGARLDIHGLEQGFISYFSDKLSILPTTTENQVAFTITAEDGTPGTIVAIFIGPGVLQDLDNLVVTYDGNTIGETTNIEQFFNIESQTTPEWLRILTTNGLYLFVKVTSFSEHTITISSILEVMGGLDALIIYMVIAVIVTLVFIGMGEISKRF